MTKAQLLDAYTKIINHLIIPQDRNLFNAFIKEYEQLIEQNKKLQKENIELKQKLNHI